MVLRVTSILFILVVVTAERPPKPETVVRPQVLQVTSKVALISLKSQKGEHDNGTDDQQASAQPSDKDQAAQSGGKDQAARSSGKDQASVQSGGKDQAAQSGGKDQTSTQSSDKDQASAQHSGNQASDLHQTIDELKAKLSQLEAKQQAEEPQKPAASSEQKPQPPAKAEIKEHVQDAEKVAQEATNQEQSQAEEGVKEMDAKQLIVLLPELAEFQAGLVREFEKPTDSAPTCLAVDGDTYQYGCGWKPLERPNMAVKDKSKPVCSCTFLLQTCWQPDADSFLKHWEAGAKLNALGVAKAFIAGRCVTPMWTYVALGILVSFFICWGHVHFRKPGPKEMDPRLKGSSLDPSREVSY